MSAFGSAQRTRSPSDAAAHDQERHGRATLRTWLRLLTCTTLIEGRVRTLLREQFDTTLPRFDLLAQLDAAARESVQGLTMSELSRRLMVTNGNLTGLVDRLVRERLVSRVVSPNDRRTQIVRLTPHGKRTLDAMTPEHLSWIESMFAELTDDDRTQLYTLLGKLKTSAQQSIAAPPSRTSHRS